MIILLQCKSCIKKESSAS